MSSRIATMQPGKKQKPSDRRDSFGARLRQERERRNVSVASIADSTKILGALLEGLENDDVSRWPIGFYRRAFLRSYATAIGLDPDETWREFAERFPEPDSSVVVTPTETSSRARLRLTLADRVAWFVGGPLIERLPSRVAAVAFDLVVIGAVTICAFVALGQFWLPFGLAAVCYYSGGVLLLGNSPGVCLFAPLPGNGQRQPPSLATHAQPGEPKATQAKKVTPIQRFDVVQGRRD